uniref:Uncharacterized protein n=1 Tax=Panagrolaimus superbus TaxID=310955 RepID=A0A914Z3I1_9BILA
MEVNPEFVIYDILDAVFVPHSEIQIKPEWAFNIAYTEKEEEKHTVIEVQTWKGPFSVDPVSVLGLVFIGLHKEAERVSGKKLSNVFVKTTKCLNRIHEDAIRKAVKISRLECAGIEAMHVLKVD